MSQIEPEIKEQFSRFFYSKDWIEFKQMADYYLDVAVHLMIKDVDAHLRRRKLKLSRDDKLRIRNVQKRLFIGLACEHLLKARYLKEGYGINTPKNGGRNAWRPYKIAEINIADYEKKDSVTMNPLLDHLKDGPCFSETQQQVIEKGFRIAKVFRNKEGHIAARGHRFDDQNYTDIEEALRDFYQEAFREKLRIRISVKPKEKPLFEIKRLEIR